MLTTGLLVDQVRRLLDDGSQWGISFTYIVQPSPDGLAQAYILAEDFLAGAPSAMVLGDNIFFGHGLPELLASADARDGGGTERSSTVGPPRHYPSWRDESVRRPRRTPSGTRRGKSGLLRARWWVTPTRGDPRDSATENRPPGRLGAPGKGETVVQETTSTPGDGGGSVNPTRSKTKRTTGPPAVCGNVRGLLARVPG